MILSTQTHYTGRAFGVKEAVRMIAAAGFDAADLSLFYEDPVAPLFGDDYVFEARELKKTAEACGVYFNQSHAPFPTLKENDEDYNAVTFPRVERAVRVAGLCGAKSIIVHPVYFSDACLERNTEMYLRLAPAAREAGIRIAIENMWGRDNRRGVICKNVCSDAPSLLSQWEALPKDVFTVCLDVGHVGLVGEYEAETIRALGSEALTCVHIHDNDYVHDSHTAPFTMKLPWKDIAAAFAEIGYRGDITLEADDFLGGMPPRLYPAGLAFLQAAGRELIQMIGECV